MSHSEQKNQKTQNKAYLKALPLRSLTDVEVVKHELNLGNVLILKITPLARKSIEDIKKAVNQLSDFAQSIGGDIASLGEERVVVVPSFIRIWRPEAVAPKNAATAA